MKKTYIIYISYTCLLFLLVFSNSVFAQTEEQKAKILEQYDLAKIKLLQEELLQKNNSDRERALALAKINGWEVYKYNEDGSFDELVGLYPDGSPKYFSLNNTAAALSSRASFLNSGGAMGLQLDGQNMVGGVWDGGPVRASHQEFNNRVIIGDGVFSLNNNSFHATHVTGTVAAAGVDFSAKGMANQATVKSFTWTNDEAEVLQEIQNGLLLSNHSYGTPLANSPGDWYPGAYSPDARVWDQIHYVSPYYLMIVSAGNDGGNTNSTPTTFGFDKLMGNKNAKNNLVIANALDANINMNGDLVSVNINAGSSQGPSDDLRIKPDITGNGSGLYSTNSTSDSAYLTISGTSMASPNVMGTLLLIQQHYSNLNQKFLKASTLKALACHTADDAGLVGPDARFGWGLINAKAAANTITNNGLNSWVSEERLNQNQVYTKTVKSTNNTPLIATISWTDVPGTANIGVLNDPTPALVNDLDIRITQGSSVFYPWKLQPDATRAALRNSDNNVDTVESVKIDNANGGDYTITITHKGNLVDNFQDFGLIITGIQSSFGFVPQGYDQVLCSSENAVFGFNFRKTSGPNVTFSVTDVPQGALAEFSSTSLNSDGFFTLTLSQLSAVNPGVYTVGVTGSNGTESETRYVTLKVLSPNFTPFVSVSPTNGQTSIGSTVTLNWQPDVNAENYIVELATDVTFYNIIRTSTTTQTSFTVSNLNDQTVYYWRVKPSNRCGAATQFGFSSFQTGLLFCTIPFNATNYNNAVIGTVANSIATVPLTISGGYTIGDLNVRLNISHTWIQDMTINLYGPASIGSPKIILFEEPCGGEDDIVATLDDSGTNIVCGNNPGISGVVKPLDPLSVLNNLPADGVWWLEVVDNHNQDGGQINQFGIDICSLTNIINLLSFQNNGIVTDISSTKVILNTEMNASTPNQNSQSQVYTLLQTPGLGQLFKNGTLMTIGNTFTQNDINLNRITYVNTLTESNTDSFKVSILNAFSGWIPEREIPITIQSSLNLSDFNSKAITVVPNPASDTFTVQIPFNLNEPIKMEMFDLQGRKISSVETSNQTETLSVAHLSEGIYLLTISYNNQTITKKISVKK